MANKIGNSLQSYEERWQKEREARAINRESQRRQDRRVIIWAFTGAGVLLVAMALTYVALRIGWPAIWPRTADPETSGQFGDALGPFASLFSAIALYVAIYATIMQRQELALQRDEHQENRAEQEGQRLAMEDQAAIQKAALAVDSLSIELELLKFDVSEAKRTADFVEQLRGTLENMRAIFARGGASKEVSQELSRIQVPSVPIGVMSFSAALKSLEAVQSVRAAVIEFARLQPLMAPGYFETRDEFKSALESFAPIEEAIRAAQEKSLARREELLKELQKHRLS